MSSFRIAKHPKQDLRIGKSRNALSGALFLLLERSSLGVITISDICEAAMVSRATFYAHFDDKFHLLRFGMEQIRIRLAASSGGDRRTLITNTIRYIGDNSALFHNLFLDESALELRRMLSGLFIDDFVRELEQKQAEGHALPAPVQHMSIFLAGGVANLLVWWINSGFPVSGEVMVEDLMAISDVMRGI